MFYRAKLKLLACKCFAEFWEIEEEVFGLLE